MARGEFGCLMLKVGFKNWEQCLKLVPDDFVFNDETKNFGKEIEPHTTVLFGFDKKSTDIEKIKSYISSLNRNIKINIVGISSFKNKEFGVLKFDVESEDLNELNKYFKDNFDYKNDHPVYHPHITILYIKTEHSDELPEIKFDKPFTIESKEFKYSDGEKKLHFDSISKGKESLKEDEEIKVSKDNEPLGKFQYNQILAPNKQTDLFITDLEIYDKYRGKGYFSYFLDKIKAFASSKGFKTIYLEPDITKGSEYTKFLTSLYLKHGFKQLEDGLMRLDI